MASLKYDSGLTYKNNEAEISFDSMVYDLALDYAGYIINSHNWSFTGTKMYLQFLVEENELEILNLDNPDNNEIYILEGNVFNLILKYVLHDLGFYVISDRKRIVVEISMQKIEDIMLKYQKIINSKRKNRKLVKEIKK